MAFREKQSGCLEFWPFKFRSLYGLFCGVGFLGPAWGVRCLNDCSVRTTGVRRTDRRQVMSCSFMSFLCTTILVPRGYAQGAHLLRFAGAAPESASPQTLFAILVLGNCQALVAFCFFWFGGATLAAFFFWFLGGRGGVI